MRKKELKPLAMQLVDKLIRAGATVTTAESCTGGLVSKLITDVAGSSECFEYGFVTYSNAAKQQLLGVPAATIDRFGAVSEATVRAMAEGAVAASGADLAVSVSGIAGPGGGSAAKPVGTVWFGFAAADGTVTAEKQRFPGNRGAVRRASAAYALGALLARL
ncbi:MAG: nicotinamide-nucleotide amidase [Pseudomonadota bacterium]